MSPPAQDRTSYDLLAREILNPYFQVYPHAFVISDPAMANVRGFLKYANRVFRSERGS